MILERERPTLRVGLSLCLFEALDQLRTKTPAFCESALDREGQLNQRGLW